MTTTLTINMTPEELRSLIKEAVREENKISLMRRTKPYSKKDAKEFLGVSYPTLDKWTEKGILERIEIGGRVYFSVESVESANK